MIRVWGYSSNSSRCFGLMTKKDFIEAACNADLDHIHSTRSWISHRVGCGTPQETEKAQKEPGKLFVTNREGKIMITDHTPVIFFDGKHCVEQMVMPGYDPLEMYDPRKEGKTDAEIQAIDAYDADLERRSPDAAMPLSFYFPDPFEAYRSIHNITKERPKDGNSCPRCFSKRVKIGYPYIVCHTCHLTEPLIDFPISQSYHQELLRGNL